MGSNRGLKEVIEEFPYASKEKMCDIFIRLQKNNNELIKEIDLVVRELEKIYRKNPTLEIKEMELKGKVAKICMKLIEETSRDKDSIKNISYLIGGIFTWYNFGDKLEEAIGLAIDIGREGDHLSLVDILNKRDKIKRILYQYLKK